MRLSQIGLRVAQALWLMMTALWLFGLLAFAHIGVALVLLLGSALILGPPLYRVLVGLKPSLSRQLGLWAFWSSATAIGLFLPLFWFLGIGQTWQDRWAWPTADGSALTCAFQYKPSLGAGDFRFVVGWPIGSVATLVLETHALSFAWVEEAQNQPRQIGAHLMVYQKQLGPYFNQAKWYRLGHWLGLVSDAKPRTCLFDQQIRPHRLLNSTVDD